MKKLLAIIIPITILVLAGTGTLFYNIGRSVGQTPDNKDITARTTNKSSSSPAEKAKEITESSKPIAYSANEKINVSTENGGYVFSVIEAKILPPFRNAREAVYQVTYQYENIDFGKNDEKLLIEGRDLKIKDDQGFVLSAMSSAWDGDWSDGKELVRGEKCLSKMTYVIVNEESKYLDITFDHLENQNSFIRVPVANQ